VWVIAGALLFMVVLIVGTMTRQGIEDLTVRMTDFGRRFVDWISLVNEMSSGGMT
jgi:hypothetical protein